MARLSAELLRRSGGHPILQETAPLDLPVRILQFGTGVLLRGLPAYFVETANRQGIFNGRIAAVKSTRTGDISALQAQDNLYTLMVRGWQNAKPVAEDFLCTAMQTIMPAATHWQHILKRAANPDTQIVISNTTEAGLQYLPEKLVPKIAATSFPGKLLQCLWHRFDCCGRARAPGMIILPTELVSDNGYLLHGFLLTLARHNDMPGSFISWIEKKVVCCNTLVDRIVPGRVNEVAQQELSEHYGYEDQHALLCEPYALWAIEGDAGIAEQVSFAHCHSGIRISPDISMDRELKLRVLNGTHSFLCGKAMAVGFETVYEAFQEPSFQAFARNLIFEEILPSLPAIIGAGTKNQFAEDVLDRFANPHIAHAWRSIAAQYPAKVVTRLIPLLKAYRRQRGYPPPIMTACLCDAMQFILDDRNFPTDAQTTSILEAIRSDFPEPERRLAALQTKAEIWGEDLSPWLQR